MPPTIDWLAETKLRPPLAQAGAIERSVLPRLVDGVRAHRLTLLSAPAGYGKTSLLGELARTPALTVAWYSVDADDDDPGRLLAGLGRSVDLALGTLAPAWSAPLDEPPARPGAALLDRVERAAPDPFVLILDDLHLVTAPAVHELLAWLIERMPPRMHLVVSARYDPPLRLARLRAARAVFELRPADLRLSPDESRRLLAAALRRPLAPDELDRLATAAEGWPAGLVLLGSSAGADAASRAQQPARERRLVFDFLAEEVLALQEPDVRRFLLETSILPELTPSRCDAVTGRSDSRAILELLLRRNLFLVELEAAADDEPVCRHHALFAEFLRGLLRRELPDLVPELHRRAAEAERQPDRAIDHWLAAGAWEEAARAIEPIADGLILRGELLRLLGWLSALPDHAYRSHPRLVNARAVGMVQKGDPAGVADMLATALAEARRTGDGAMEAEIRCAEAAFAMWRADFAACTTLLDVADALPARRPATDVLTAMLRASVALFSEFDHDAAARSLHRALASPAAVDDPEAILYLALLLGPEFTVLPGALTAIEAFCARAARLPEAATGPIGLGVDDVMAPIHLRRGRLDEAVETARRALARRGELGGYLFLGLNAALSAGMARAAQGRDAEASGYFARLRASADATPLNRAIGADGRFAAARLAWLEGHLGETRALLAELEADGDAVAPFTAVLRLQLRAMVEISRGQHDAAERTLIEAVERERDAPVATVYASAAALLARLHWTRRRPRAAAEALAPLIRACAADGTPGRILQEAPLVRPVLRYAAASGIESEEAARLLVLLGDDAAAAPPGASLSERELEVVRLIADGASNAAIAERLGISLATVKSHVGHAMDKLDASSRTQIVARARSAGLIG